MTVTTIHKSASPAPVSSIAMIAAVVVALVAVAGVTLFYWRQGHVLPAVSMPSSHVSQEASAPAGAPPPNLGNRGDQFLFELKARGIALSGDGTASIKDAHSVCARFQQGESQQQIVQAIVAGTPSMTRTTANDFASAAISVYCS